MTLHAKLSASGAHRWRNCPGSVAAEEKYKKGKSEETSSIFAQEGTLAHELGDLCLKNLVDADTYIGKQLDLPELDIDTTITKEMAEFVQQYVDYVRSFQEKGDILLNEQQVDFSNVAPEGFGTLDAAVLKRNKKKKVVHIFDLKYGMGVAVSAFENEQAQLYAIGLQNDYKFIEEFDEFVIHIVQPRKGNFSEWSISAKDLQVYAETTAERAELALSSNAGRFPGEKQCQWCLVKHECKALANFVEETIGAQFDDLDSLDDAGDLSQEQQKAILDNQKLIETFVKSVEAHAYNTLEIGEEFPGYKLVEGRSIRKFTDDAEEVLVDELGKDAYQPPKLIGITEAQKKVGKELMEQITTKPPGKPTLAKESDKRPAIGMQKGFDKLD